MYDPFTWINILSTIWIDDEVSTCTGSETELGNLIYVPVRDGPTVWEIGYPDRTAMSYYVPDVNPMYVNKLFLNSPEK